MCRSKLVVRDLRHIAGWSRTYLPDDTVKFVSLTHIVANAELENNNYRMIVDHTHYQLRDSVSAMEFSQPVCTITAVSKDLVRRPTRISYDLSLAPYRTIGVSLADSARSAGVTRPVADALVCCITFDA